MDPNQALTDLRSSAEALARMLDQGATLLPGPETNTLVTAVQGLDAWLRRGGFLPHDWVRGTVGIHVMQLFPAHKMDEHDPRSFARAVCSCGDYTSSVDSPNGATRAWVEHWRARTNGGIAQ